MRYEDASHTGAFQGQGPIANDDTDQLASGAKSTATGNLITGEGTQTGSAGADVAAGGHITAIAGKGGEDSSFSGGKLSALGEYGKLSVDAEGNYVYQANKGVENVRDRFTYTLADNQGASDTASLIVEIGKTPLVIKANAQQIVVGPDGVVTLPAGVELSDIHIVGRNLVVDMPDGSQMIIIDGAVFVPQLVLGGVEVPASNVAALLVGQEIQPAAGETPPSGGGNFAVPPPPLDPGVPLGDLIPPTEYTYIPPEPQDVFDILDEEPEAGAAAAILDDDAQASGNPGGVGDDAGTNLANGSLPGSEGDGSLEWALLASGTLPAGFSFSAQPNGDMWILQGAVHVLTVSVNEDTGAYTVTQLVAIDHPAGGDENNLIFVINYSVTDDDGDVAIGTLTVNVDDDTPITTQVSVGGTVDEDGVPGGIADGPGDVAGANTVVNGSIAGLFASGADTPLTFGLVSNPTGLPTLTSNGVAVTYSVAGNTLTASAGGNTVFTLVVNADGTYTFTLVDQIDHPTLNGLAGDDTENDLSLALGSAIQATDGDGDSVTAPANGLVIVVDDDTPIALQGTSGGTVDEDGVLEGIDDNGDGDGNPGGVGDVAGEATTATGSIATLFASGADAPLTFSLKADTSGLPDLTSGGVEVTYVVSGNTLTASAGGNPVFTLVLQANGSWTFTLIDQLDHDLGLDENDLTIDFSSILQATDADGDSVDANERALLITVDDDTPEEFEECPEEVITVNDPSADPFTGSLNLPPVGADEPGVVTFGVVDGDPVLDTEGQPVTSGGEELFYFINDQGVLEARVGDETGDVIFTITLNGDGTFTYDQVGPLGEGGEFTFDDLTSASAGNVEFRGVGADDPATTVDLLLSASTSAGADETVNTDSDSIGSANQSMDIGETVRIDLVSDLTTGAGTPSGFGYSGHVSSSSFIGLIPQVQGDQSQTVAFTVWALNSTVAQGTEPDRDPTGGFSDSTITAITEVTVKDYLSGDSTTVDVTGFTVGVFTAVAYGISARVNADGSVTFSGIQQGDSYGFSTGAGEFNAIAVQSQPAGTGGSTQDSFDLGIFSIGVANEFEPVDLQVPIVLTDADGDPVVCDIDIHIGPPLEATDITVTVNEAGLPIGSDPASDSEIESGDLQNLVTGGTGPYTFAFAPGEDGDGAFGTLILNPDGTFTYTLDTPFDTQPDTNDGTNPELGRDSFEVIATDSEGATQTITIRVNIIDDIPSVDVTVNNEAAVLLTTQDADTIGVATDQDVTTANFSGAFGVTTIPGADGQQSLTNSYSLAVLNSVSGLTSHGDAINLYNVGGVIVGSTAGAPPASLADASIVFTIAVDANTGVVTLQQMQQIDHTNADPTATGAPFDDHLIALANGKVSLTRESTITDNDGDVDTDSAVIDLGGNIRFADHGPDAKNDVDDIVSGGDTATGNVITGVGTNAGTLNADVVGADTPGRVSGVVSVNEPANTDQDPDPNVFEIDGEFGTLVLNADGSYTYTRFDGAPGNSQDVFTYTLIDFDGDTDTATLTINIGDAAPNLPDPALILLDDDVIPAAGGNLNGPGDDDPDAVPGNVVNGNLVGTGGDGTLTYNFTGIVTLPLVGGFTYNQVDADTAQVLQGATVVMTIQLNQATGAFTVTQNAPILHPADEGGAEDDVENNLVFSIGVEVEDADNDVEPATITINVDDDTPTATATLLTGTVDEDGVLEGAADNGEGDGIAGGTGDVGGQAVTAVGNVSTLFSIGADGLGSYSLLSDFTALIAQNLSSGGVALSYSVGFAAGVYTLTATAGLGGETVFTFTLNATTGAYEFTLVDQLDHPTLNGLAGDNTENDLAVNLSSLIQATDADGDSVVAGANGLIITVDDDTPIATTAQLTGTVDEDGVVENVAAGVQAGDGIAGGTDDVAGEVVAVSGSFTTLFQSGADEPLTYQLVNAAALNALALSSGGVALTYQINFAAGVYTLTASAGGNTVFTLTLNEASGAYTFTLVDQLDHLSLNGLAGDNTENDLLINLSAVIQATDRDGDSIPAGASALVITVDDDMPVVFDPEAIGEGELFNLAGSTQTANLDIDANINNNVGADEPGLVQFANIANGDDSGFDSGGVNITYWLSNNGQTLQGRTGSTNGTDGTLIFTVQLNQAAGTYTVTMAGEIDNGSGVTFNNLTSTAAGNVDVRGVGADDPATTVDLLLTASGPGGVNQTINTDSDSVGSGNQSMDEGETVRIDFVTNLEDDPADDLTTYPSGFSYDGHVGTNSLLQFIPQVQGSQTETVAFRVYALNTTVTDAALPDDVPTGPGDGWSDSTIVPVTMVTIDGWDDGDPDDVGFPLEPAVTVALGAVDVWTEIAYGVWAQLQADGSVIFTGVQQGDQYGIETGSDFNAFAVTSLPAGIGPNAANDSSTNSFDLGVFSIGQVDTGDPINLNFDLQLTDFDGDTIVVTDALAIQIDPAADAPALNSLAINSGPANDDAAQFSLLADTQESQKTAANSNTLTLAAAVAAAGVSESAAASSATSDQSGELDPQVFTTQTVERLVADDGGDDSASVAALPESDAVEAEQSASSGHGNGNANGHDNQLDAGSNQAADEASALQAANDDQGPASAEPQVATVATVQMASAEALQAAGLEAGAQHNGAVEKIIADALDDGNGQGVVDALLNAIHGGSGEVPALANLASPSGAAVSAWDMASNGGSAGNAEMLMKVGAEMLHHDMVQPTHNG